MPDKKLTDVTDTKFGEMTDSEIVNCFEWIKNCNGGLLQDCIGCPLQNHYPNCEEALLDISFDLINRLQADKKNLQERNVILKGLVDTQKAEIERLITNNDWLKGSLNYDFSVIRMRNGKDKKLKQIIHYRVKEIKAEAYKEVEDKITELFLRYAFLHSHADMARQDYIKAVDGTEIEMQSVWDVFTLQKYGVAHYDEMTRLQTNIELMEKERLLAELEKDFRLLVKELVGETDG